jgi:hypothetical protein
MSGGEFKSLEESLEKNLPKEDYDEVRRILYGKNVEKLECPEAARLAEAGNFEFKAYSLAHTTAKEQGRKVSHFFKNLCIKIIAAKSRPNRLDSKLHSCSY